MKSRQDKGAYWEFAVPSGLWVIWMFKVVAHSARLRRPNAGGLEPSRISDQMAWHADVGQVATWRHKSLTSPTTSSSLFLTRNRWYVDIQPLKREALKLEAWMDLALILELAYYAAFLKIFHRCTIRKELLLPAFVRRYLEGFLWLNLWCRHYSGQIGL